MHQNSTEFNILLDTIKQLRGPLGCPWDKKQTAYTLTQYLREEVTELLTAINKNDTTNICEEIGDVLYILIMISEIHSEKNIFSFSDVISEINKKLVRRHPHVFDGKKVSSDEELRLQWESIKQEEKQKK